ALHGAGDEAADDMVRLRALGGGERAFEGGDRVVLAVAEASHELGDHFGSSGRWAMPVSRRSLIRMRRRSGPNAVRRPRSRRRNPRTGGEGGGRCMSTR